MTDLGRLGLLCLQRARVSGDIVAELGRWLDMIRRVLAAPRGRDAIGILLRYVLGVSDAEPERLLALLEEGLGDEGKEAFMTGAEKLIEMARSKARAEGRAEGRADVVLRLLALRFGGVDAAAAELVRTASPEALDAFTERLLTAASLDEVLDGRPRS